MKTPRQWAEYIYNGFPGSEDEPADEITLIERAITEALADERDLLIRQACDAINAWTESTIVNGKILRKDAKDAVKSLRRRLR